MQRCARQRPQPRKVQQLRQVRALALPFVHHVFGQQHEMPGQALTVFGRELVDALAPGHGGFAFVFLYN